MLFKLLWQILKTLRIAIPIVLLGLSAWGIYRLYQVIPWSFFGQVPAAVNQVQKVVSLISPTPTETIPTTAPTPLTSTPILFTTQTGTNFNCQAEIATTTAQQQLGLMSRDSLPPYNCMLFVFADPVSYPFWMKNVNFPLDIIFLDKNKTIVDIIPNAPACKTVNPAQDNCPFYAPKGSYLYAIEVLGGTTQKYNITNKSGVSFRY